MPSRRELGLRALREGRLDDAIRAARALRTPWHEIAGIIGVSVTAAHARGLAIGTRGDVPRFGRVYRHDYRVAVRRAREAGESYASIGAQLGFTEARAWHIAKQLGLTGPRA